MLAYLDKYYQSSLTIMYVLARKDANKTSSQSLESGTAPSGIDRKMHRW